MSSSETRKLSGAARLSLSYLAVAGLWILLSDQVVEWLISDVSLSSRIQTWKGVLFVLATALALYLLIRRDERREAGIRAERERALRALHDRQLILDTFIQHVPAAVAMFDRQMRYLLASRHWCDRFRLDPGNVIGRCHYDLFPELPDDWREAHRRAFAGEILRNDADLLVRADGTETWEHWEIRPCVTGSAGVESIVIFSEDVTRMKSTLLRLEESEQRWKFAIEGGELGLWDWNIVVSTVFYSPRWKDMLGYGEDEISDQLDERESRVHPEDLPGAMAELERHLRGATHAYVSEHRMRCKDGSFKWILDRGRVVAWTEDGRPLRMIGTQTDLSAQKQREEELSLYANLFRHSSEGILICDADNHIVSTNHAFTGITGYSQSEVTGRDPSLLASGRHDPDFFRDLWLQLESTGQWQGEIWNRRKDGETFAAWLTINTLRNRHGGITHFLSIFSDITQRKLAEASISHMAHHDVLTDLPNRHLLRERVDQALVHAQRGLGNFALLFLDLDRFKNINDSLGHNIGDGLLVEIARRLSGVLREQDTVSRLGGDEFIMLLPETDAEGAAHVAGKLLAATVAPFVAGGHELTVTPSVGIALYPDNGDDFESLLQCSDAAMYRAKKAGGNTYRFFTTEMYSHASHVLQLENALRRALERNELRLLYQPQVDLASGRLIGCEALVRWNHPELGDIPPRDFIPIAEDSGLILPLGGWVLRTAAKRNSAWQRAGLSPLVMAVNLSPAQFRQPGLLEQVLKAMDSSGLAPPWLELELTESIMMDEPEHVITTLERLHGHGLRLAIDDFGTGYSSLSYLKRFRIHRLKIDRSFVSDLGRDGDSEAIVEAIIGMARSLGLRTIAEGVETPAQLAWLKARGCDEAQGFLIGAPMTHEEIETLLRAEGAPLAARTG